MKRFFAILAAGAMLLAATTTATAQQRGDWQVRGGAGVLSLPDVFGVIVVGFGSIDTSENVTSHEFVPLTSPTIEVNYWLGDKVALGGSLSVGYAAAWSTFNDSGKDSRRVSALYPTLCLSAQTRYFRKGNFMMYGSWGVGAMTMVVNQYNSDEGQNNSSLGFSMMGNLYPLGFQFGHDKAFFVELGWGAKGTLNVGGCFNF